MDSYEFDTSSTEHNPLLERGGGWDECGLVESLDRKGFTSNKSCCELKRGAFLNPWGRAARAQVKEK